MLVVLVKTAETSTIDGRCGVGAGDGAQMHCRRNDAARPKIGADVRDVPSAQREEMPVTIEGEFRFADMVAVVVVREHALDALGDPFDRRTELARGPQRQRVFGII
jgi:hypothetical protein